MNPEIWTPEMLQHRKDVERLCRFLRSKPKGYRERFVENLKLAVELERVSGGAQGGFIYVGRLNAVSNATAAANIAIPYTGATLGNLMHISAVFGNNTFNRAFGSITDSGGNTIQTEFSAGTGPGMGYAVGSTRVTVASGTITVSVSSGNATWAAQLHEFHGVVQSGNWWDANNAGTKQAGTGLTGNTISVTPANTLGGQLGIGIAGIEVAGPTYTPASGWTQIGNVFNVANVADYIVQYQDHVGPGSVTSSGTFGTGSDSHGLIDGLSFYNYDPGSEVVVIPQAVKRAVLY